jgi:hypothetical protein
MAEDGEERCGRTVENSEAREDDEGGEEDHWSRERASRVERQAEGRGKGIGGQLQSRELTPLALVPSHSRRRRDVLTSERRTFRPCNHHVEVPKVLLMRRGGDPRSRVREESLSFLTFDKRTGTKGGSERCSGESA